MAGVTREELEQAWQQVRSMETLPEVPPAPKLPVFTTKTTTKARLLGIQRYISALEYNYTGTQYFEVNKNRSFKAMVSTAKEIINEMLPIQCLEAVCVAAYLTASVPELDRFPLSFKSTSTGDVVHRHIVLAVRHQHHTWGALGLSRSDKLMFKELRYNSLSELVQDFQLSFESVGHSLVKLYLGFPFTHDIHSSEHVEWRVLNLPLTEWTTVATHLDGFAKEAQDLMTFKQSKGTLPEWFAARYPAHVPELELGHSPSKHKHFGMDSFEFPGDYHGPEDCQLQVKEQQPQDAPKISVQAPPILVAPDHLVFKRALADADQVLPTNVFLQNTTPTCLEIEVCDPTNQLEVVTKSAKPTSQQPPRTDDNSGSNQPSAPTVPLHLFRVSPNGMIVIAIRCRTSTAAAVTNSTSSTPSSTPRTTTAPGATEKAAPVGLTPRRTRISKGGSILRAVMKPPKNAIILRVLRVAHGSSDGDTREGDATASDANANVIELPFSVTC